MCRLWGRLRAEQQSIGPPIAPQDAWIAATALRHGLSLITHNAGDFEGIAQLDVRTAAKARWTRGRIVPGPRPKQPDASYSPHVPRQQRAEARLGQLHADARNPIAG